VIGRAAAMLALAGLVGLAACSPEPRGVAYFQAHRDEAARVVTDCRTGAHRGQECVNAQAGVAAVAREARINRYKQNF
jgi:hypothetical protein